MIDFTDEQKRCIRYFEANINDWLADELKKDKFIVISEDKIRGIFDKIDTAFEFAALNLRPGGYIIQRIVDESKIVNYINPAFI